jgi:hypothetical protein
VRDGQGRLEARAASRRERKSQSGKCAATVISNCSTQHIPPADCCVLRAGCRWPRSLRQSAHICSRLCVVQCGRGAEFA